MDLRKLFIIETSSSEENTFLFEDIAITERAVTLYQGKLTRLKREIVITEGKRLYLKTKHLCLNNAFLIVIIVKINVKFLFKKIYK